MPNKTRIEITFKNGVNKPASHSKKHKQGRQVRFDKHGDYCITETVGVDGVIENTFVMRVGEIDSVKVT